MVKKIGCIISDIICGSDIKEFTKELCREAVTLLGKTGYVSVTDDSNMENNEKVKCFWKY